MSIRDQARAQTKRTPASGGDVGTQVSSFSAANASTVSSDGSRHSVELHIEELVLEGFEPAHRYAIGEALERELTRLFTEQDVPAGITSNLETSRLDGSSLQIDRESNPEVVGARVARAIYGGFDL